MTQYHIHKLEEAKKGDTVKMAIPDLDRSHASLYRKINENNQLINKPINML